MDNEIRRGSNTSAITSTTTNTTAISPSVTTASSSPLVQLERGNLRPKVFSLYEQLFIPSSTGEYCKPDSYWSEFFLLRCNQIGLHSKLDSISSETMLARKEVTQELFEHAVENLRKKDYAMVENSLVILSVFFQSLFKKNFVSYSTDIISLIAGLENIDKIFPLFLNSVNMIIQDCPSLSIRVLAIRTTSIIAGGVYQTSLASYFLHRNLFASIMQFIGDDESKLYIGDGISLLGVLASYDKLEGFNPYQVRFSDFIDNNVMLRIIQASGHAWNISLERYSSAAYRPYLLGGESVGNANAGAVSNVVSWIGGGISELSGLIWKRQDIEVDSVESDDKGGVKDEDNELPHATLSILLAIYEFIQANKVFCRLLIETKGMALNQVGNGNGKSNQNIKSKELPSPFTLFISLSSYLLQNQHKSSRANSYARLCLIVLRILVEDSSIIQNQLINEDLKSNIHLCRLRNPPLPLVNDKIILLSGILDSLIGCIRFNMKRTIDFEMYNLTLKVLFQIISTLRNLKIRINYHWQEVWKSLISFIKFLNNHLTRDFNDSKETIDLLLLILGTLLVHGEIILYDNNQYYDLFYRMIEASDDFSKFSNLYQINSPSMMVINKTINHYKTSIGNNNLSPNQIIQIIKEASPSLSLYQIVSGFENDLNKKYLLYDNLPVYKESEERLFVKKMTRVVINDIRMLYQLSI